MASSPESVLDNREIALPSNQGFSWNANELALPEPVVQAVDLQVGPILIKLMMQIQKLFAWIVGAWSLGVAFCLLRPLLGWRMLHHLRTTHISMPGENVLVAFSSAIALLPVRRSVQVFISQLVNCPLVVGYFRPAILLPASLVYNVPIAQLETLILHELAHIRRHDFLINLAQSLIESLFFYHPAIWWMSNRLRLEREHCCDDLVVGLTGNSILYGRALLAVGQQDSGSTALALGASDGALLSRIRRLAHQSPNAIPGNANHHTAIIMFSAFAASLVLVIGMVVWIENKNVHMPVVEQARSKWIATIDNRIEVEFIGVRNFQSVNERQGDGSWWSPEGMLLEEPPKVSGGSSSSIVGSETVSDAREFLFQISGLKRGDSVTIEFGEAELATDATSTTASSFADGLCATHKVAWPFKSKTAQVKVSVATGGHVIVTSVDKKGVVHSDDPEFAMYLDNLKVSESSGLHKWEIYAVDSNGAQHQATLNNLPIKTPAEAGFDVSKSETQRFEYRIRTYEHSATFSNVSLTPEEKTQVSISVDSR